MAEFKKIIRVLVPVLLITTAWMQVGCSLFGVRTEENPQYDVVQTDGKVEVRRYKPYVIARTTVSGDYKKAQGEAFRILAAYIFGSNEKKQKLEMTAPVTQSKSTESEKISMTAPVNISAAPSEKISMTAPVNIQGQSGTWVMSFMMPSKYKIEDLPTPKDQRIEFAQVPGKLVATIRYSGYQNEKLNAKKASELTTWIAQHPKYKAVSLASFAGYDPPWTLPMFRRNEMWIEVSE